MAGTLEIPTIGSPNSTQDPKIKASLETLNGKLNSENKLEGANIVSASVTNTQLAAAAKPFVWYTPKIIATEQSTSSTTYTTLTTADEITGVVLPENGLMVIGYWSLAKQSVSTAARTAIFLGSNQLKENASNVQETQSVSGTSEYVVGTCTAGLQPSNTGAAAAATTGQILGAAPQSNFAGLTTVFAAAGIYAVSIKWKASSGSVTAKERKLWVGVMGV